MPVLLPDGQRQLWVLKRYECSPRGVEMAQRETLALTRLREVGYPVPQLVLAQSDARAIGRPFIVMEHIDGVPLWDRLRDADAAQRLGPADQRPSLTEAFVGSLVALHRLDPAILQPADPAPFLTQELGRLRRDASASVRADLVRVVDWLREHRSSVRSETSVILHRDYHPWNVLIDRTDQLWVLDWDWGVGDPRFDLAWTSTLIGRSGAEELGRALVAEYARRRGRPVTDMAYFEVLTTLRWLLNVLPALEPDSTLDERRRIAFREFLVEPVTRAEELLADRTGLPFTKADAPRED